ncbi:hypothetical protein FOA52_005711 [Chlamydomonas sp. UWO 241]|nr:hypothetical protein FOA52_005711 [Chlamydomonas sp. UWO 241]
MARKAEGLAEQAHATIGCFASEENAARAYDCAAVQAHGPGTQRNFPAETISELPVTVGEQKQQRSSSRYIGVSWHKAQSAWQAHGPGAKRNFPGEAIGKVPLPMGEQKKQRSSSRYVSVT